MAENKKKRKKLKLLLRCNKLSQSKESSESKEDDDSDYVQKNYNNTSEQKKYGRKKETLCAQWKLTYNLLLWTNKNFEDQKHNKESIDAGASIQKTISKFVL